ncbi:hypothetical protein ATANTOWER_016348 [Ataeniobius toweri]|uniref:Uncharacterized protein n=1 Tax=Ataeniobius toweri TaxID=208326 RepID=A0ABU7CJ16_9TELE|nr:hypothetical protein [Ataeniobius toweri]
MSLSTAEPVCHYGEPEEFQIRKEPPDPKLVPSSWTEMCSSMDGQAKCCVEKRYMVRRDRNRAAKTREVFESVRMMLSKLRTWYPLKHGGSSIMLWGCAAASGEEVLILAETWVLGGNLRQVRRPTTSTSSKVKLQIMDKYELAVQASYNNTRSPLSDKITFEPLYSTIGPPLLSLAGCGSCIQINISLPDKIQRQYDSSFRVQWKKGKDGEIQKNDKIKATNAVKNPALFGASTLSRTSQVTESRVLLC